MIFTNNKGWQVTDLEPAVNYRKGTGLLDVYMGPLNITVPEKTTGEVYNLAKKFSQPYSNGFDPVIAVNYQVISDSSVNENLLQNSNYIVVDYNCTNKIVQRYKEQLACTVRQQGLCK